MRRASLLISLRQQQAAQAGSGRPIGRHEHTGSFQPSSSTTEACTRWRSCRASSLRLAALHAFGSSKMLQRDSQWSLARLWNTTVQEKHATRCALILSTYGG